MNKRGFLRRKLDSDLVEKILEEQKLLHKNMLAEQKERLTKNQYKEAKRSILDRIAFFSVLAKHLGEAQALKLAKEYYYAKAKGFVSIITFLSKSNIGCNLFQKAFTSGLKKDTFIVEMKQNDKKAFIFDIKKCLYKDLCDYYNLPNCCTMFCDGDWLVFGNMKKMKFERKYTLGYGDKLCDFHYFRRK